MSVLMKVGPGKNSPRRIYINVMETKDGNKKGYDVWINEVLNGKKLDGLKAKMFLNGKGDDLRMEVSGPIRRVDSEGNFILEGKFNADLDYVNELKEPVPTEDEAEKQYQYIKDNTGGFLFGKIATIKVVNQKTDKETGLQVPTKSTYLSAKVYSDAESYKIARTHYESTTCKELDKPSVEARLKKEIIELGTWNNLFVNSGSEFLTKMGIEFRESASEEINNSIK